jgi:hypothetical protein
MSGVAIGGATQYFRPRPSKLLVPGGGGVLV